MKLYLARHGDYVLDTTKAQDVLSNKGKNEIEQLASFLKAMNLRVESILHSEKNRAKETAELLAQGIQVQKSLVSQKGLAPDDDVVTFVDELPAFRHDVLIVGHLPFMGRLVSLLITGEDSQNVINFQPGTMVCLEQRDQRHWMINWVLTPNMLDSIKLNSNHS